MIEISEINTKIIHFFEDTVNFCSRWDQNSFDPNYDTIDLKEFIPMVYRIFKREPHKHVYLGL